MEDATDLKSVGRNIVGVRVPPSAPIKTIGWVLGGNPSFVNQYKIKEYKEVNNHIYIDNKILDSVKQEQITNKILIIN